MTTVLCKRCDGKGRLAHFGHVKNGVCLKCNGSGKLLKVKRLIVLETHYTAVTFNGSRVHCGTDKAKAEALHAEWTAMNCEGRIEFRDVKRTSHIPI